MATLIYIGGYGRSGSTLIEYLLTCSSEVVACGEVERHLRSFGRKKLCTCGRRPKSCPVWSAFQHKKRRLKDWDHERLALALLEHVSASYRVMVDSSKTAWGSVAMPFRLRQKLGKDFILVQIVRDPRGVCWSAMRTPWKPEKGPQSPAIAVALGVCAGWLAANLACEAFRLRHPGNAMRVRYEELVNAPEEVIGKILGRAGLTPPPNLKGIAESDNRHQLHGNPMRFKPISPTDLKEDVAWRTAMPRFYRRLVGVLCWPLLRRYGYGRLGSLTD